MKYDNSKMRYDIFEIFSYIFLAMDEASTSMDNFLETLEIYDICSEDIFYKIIDEFGYQPKIMKLMNPISPLEGKFFLKF